MAKQRSSVFKSELRPNEPVITDRNYRQHFPELLKLKGGRRKRGYVPRDWKKEPYGSLPYAAKFDVPLIPESEWSDRIEEMERTKTRLSDIMIQAGLPSLDQDGTKYCWCNGVVTCIEAVLIRTGQPYVKLSPASVAAPIKNYRNQGGWGGEALEYIIKNGVAPASMWPPNAIKREHDNTETKAARLKFKVTEWYELPNRSFNALMTALLLRIPIAIGLNWWSHEVAAIDPVKISANSYGARIRNSWGGSYGDDGFAILSKSKATPDDAVAPRVITASS